MKFQLHFSARLLSILLCMCCLAGCEKVQPLETDDFYRFDKLSTLSIKKPVQIDYFLGIDNAEIPLNVTGYDLRGSVINAPQEAVSFYSNNVKLPGETFLPDRPGNFAIIGKLAGQVSDTIRIRVWDPATLTLSLNVSNPNNAFYATGKDTLAFRVDIMQDGKIVDIDFPYTFYVDNKEQTQEIFATATPGIYKFQVRGLGLASNEVIINALPKTSYSLIRFPVIFHEINTTNLTSERIQKLTDDMTKAYRNQFNINQAQKDPNAEDLFIAFYPAETGLDGNRLSSPGLHRTTNQKTSFDVQDAYSDAFNSFWDPTAYLNIWVYPNITGEYSSSSWAYYPSVTVPLEGLGTYQKGTQPFFPYGIFLNGNHVNINYDGGRTEEVLAHEAGHMFGLYHVFDENNSSFNNCTSRDPDYCSDTQYYDRVAYSNNINYARRYDRTSCAGVNYVSTNFMDYFYTNNNSFTTEQMERVRHTINYGLWLPTPYNGANTRRKSGRLSLVDRPEDLKFIKPVICSMR